MHEHLRDVSKAFMKVLEFSESVDFALVFNYLMVGVANVFPHLILSTDYILYYNITVVVHVHVEVP